MLALLARVVRNIKRRNKKRIFTGGGGKNTRLLRVQKFYQIKDHPFTNKRKK